jgi:quercetin dioxygenase-like cupin family protein
MSMGQHSRRILITLGLLVAVPAASDQALAQIIHCLPMQERTGEAGCWVITEEALGQLPDLPMFWHLDAYPTRAAAEAAKGQRGAVLEGLGKIWIATIGEAGWRPSSGDRIAEIGPLPLTSGEKYTARYMEAIFTPGMTTNVHRHPGPEAWFTSAGETCLETPEGKTVGRAGGPPVIVPGGVPMHLTATGAEQRRALVLILHESSRGPGSPAPDWAPKGLCGS